jgi:hypothetical protein
VHPAAAEFLRAGDKPPRIAPIAGTRLIGEWQGVEHCVTAARRGF